jgi:hypothetical protein
MTPALNATTHGLVTVEKLTFRNQYCAAVVVLIPLPALAMVQFSRITSDPIEVAAPSSDIAYLSVL